MDEWMDGGEDEWIIVTLCFVLPVLWMITAKVDEWRMDKWKEEQT